MVINFIFQVEYKYDAWGIILSITGDNTIKNVNSFLYKGYYYDFEASIYYCNSRYYDPLVKRWISIDEVSYLDSDSATGINLWCYCNNNPVMGVDYEGTQNWKPFWSFVGKVAAVVAVAVVIAVATPISFPVALAATALIIIVANHIDNVNKINRAKKEVDSMSDEELDQYLSDVCIENINLNGKTVRNFATNTSALTNTKNIEDYRTNLSKYDRIKLLTAIKRKYEAKSSIYAMSAEWQGHNILHGISRNEADIDIDDFDYRFRYKLPTYVLMILGEL